MSGNVREVSEDHDRRRAPRGLGGQGKALWGCIVKDYDLSESEAVILEEAARCRDRIAQLRVVVDAEGVVVSSPQGVKAHPALVEERNQRKLVGQLLASLRLPDLEGEQGNNSRGFYAPRAV
ncbi:terminase [Kocuria sabuli]|uniref:terminase n=1 Tax=Kocuria sabuli TaxID=3071448 RepID=UPI0034D67BE5